MTETVNGFEGHLAVFGRLSQLDSEVIFQGAREFATSVGLAGLCLANPDDPFSGWRCSQILIEADNTPDFRPADIKDVSDLYSENPAGLYS